MSKKSYILVTGGAGYIGSHTVVELIRQGRTPIIVDDFRNADRKIIAGIESIVGTKVIVHEIDACNQAEMELIFQQYPFDGIIHFAAYKAVAESVAEPIKYYSNNINSLLVCLTLAEKYAVKHFLFSSSCTVYGDPKDSVIVDEKTPMQTANSPYGTTKQMCEQILSDVVRSSAHLKVLKLRYFNPVGADESGKIGELPNGEPSNLLPYVTQTALGILEQLTVYGNDYNTPDGTCIRDYIHVTDLASAHVKGLEWCETQSAKTDEIINIGAGNGTSVLEIIHTFENISGKRLNWKYGERRVGDVEQIYADVQKARRQLQWSATRTMEDAVRDAWNWEQKWRNETTGN